MDKIIVQTSEFHFTQIDNYILDSDELDGMEQITYTHLKKYSSSKDECFPSNQTLCKKLKCSENTVRKVLRNLEAKGFISIQQRFNASNRYELLPFPKLNGIIMDNDKNTITSILNFYENNINPRVGSLERACLTSWFERFKENPELIIKAISIAVSENVRKLNYIEVLLQDWHKNGIKTVQEMEIYIKSRCEKRNFIKPKPVDTFNDYQQRNYDYDDLEKKLLGSDKEIGREKGERFKDVLRELQENNKPTSCLF